MEGGSGHEITVEKKGNMYNLVWIGWYRISEDRSVLEKGEMEELLPFWFPLSVFLKADVITELHFQSLSYFIKVAFSPSYTLPSLFL